MEAIRDLPCLRSTKTGRFRKLATSIPADYLDRGIARQPRSGRSRVGLGKHIEGAVSFQVTNKCAVSSPSTPGEVVEAHHARRFDRLVWETTQQVQQRIWAHAYT